MISVDKFLEILDMKFDESYTIGICKSISLAYMNENISYSLDDLKQDCILHFLENDRYKKIKKENGVRISIEMYLKYEYRRVKKSYRRKVSYYDENLFIPEEQLKVLDEIGYTKTDLKLHGYFYHNINMKKLNLCGLLMKNNRKNMILVNANMIRLLSLVCDINDDENIIAINNYMVTRVGKNVPSMFIGTGVTTNKTYIDKDKILKYLKNKYIERMEEIFGN